MKYLRYSLCLLTLLVIPLSGVTLAAGGKEESPQSTPLSSQTKACLNCHSRYTPGIVQDWSTSRHSRTTPAAAMEKPPLEKRMSAESIPEGLTKVVVGCYECHSRDAAAHKDNFDHMGFRINVVVTPDDCKTCHPVEAGEFSGSKKSYAYRDLMENPFYETLVNTITGLKQVRKGNIASRKPSGSTLHDTCLGCHGTKVEVKGSRDILTKIGDIRIPDLSNWPNQGVGRINPDGSRGACSACHPRHSFSIDIARQPYTCSQCHLEPDVPAWNVYDESKHGDILFSTKTEWDFDSVPWVPGKDFKTPSCAACHNSLLVSPAGDIIAERTHDFGARLWVRLFGLIYSTPQPKSGDTTIMRNKDGLSLPVTLTGEPAQGYLIDKAEQKKRLSEISSICNSCHSSQWVQAHFLKLDKTIAETDAMTLAATRLLLDAWNSKLADRKNPFDEPIEQMWISQWLFYSNSIRYSSAMTGAPDYTSFKNGWWNLTENLDHMKDWIELRKRVKETGGDKEKD
jgi:hydroxylamine dehydrogenase